MRERSTAAHQAAGVASEAATVRTRALLACGVLAGLLWVVVALLQAFTREGFDFRRHPISVLSNGDLGWIQITSFVVSGLLFVASAVGVRRALHPGRGGTWGPLLIGIVGVGMIAAGFFVADPADGFPPGTPPGRPATLSWHGVLHFVANGVAFIALIALCFVLARRFAGRQERGWTVYSTATGVVFLAVWLALSARPENDAVTVAFGVSVLHGVTWLSLAEARLRTELSDTGAA
jgi:Protein of unknown function (DUF998)